MSYIRAAGKVALLWTLVIIFALAFTCPLWWSLVPADVQRGIAITLIGLGFIEVIGGSIYLVYRWGGEQE